ncbi:MAG: serine O-acetyltransferase [Candidatus Solibacter sp.]|nr:serine O-acetyltransferase [Candidatus Solibacter sp.]
MAKYPEYPFPKLIADFRADYQRSGGAARPLPLMLAKATVCPGLKAISYYRLSHYLWCRGLLLPAKLLHSRMVKTTGADIQPAARIGPGCWLPHPVGVVVGMGVEVGAACTIYQSATLGESLSPIDGHSYPRLGNRVLICSGAVVVGPITVGDDVVVGANSFLRQSVDSGCLVAGAPARILRRPPSPDPAGLPSTARESGIS